MERTEEGRDLIETLWNVKTRQLRTLTGGGQDLIETLWNVKLATFVRNVMAFLGFNRDIVECKAGS